MEYRYVYAVRYVSGRLPLKEHHDTADAHAQERRMGSERAGVMLEKVEVARSAAQAWRERSTSSVLMVRALQFKGSRDRVSIRLDTIPPSSAGGRFQGMDHDHGQRRPRG